MSEMSGCLWLCLSDQPAAESSDAATYSLLELKHMNKDKNGEQAAYMHDQKSHTTTQFGLDGLRAALPHLIIHT